MTLGRPLQPAAAAEKLRPLGLADPDMVEVLGQLPGADDRPIWVPASGACQTFSAPAAVTSSSTKASWIFACTISRPATVHFCPVPPKAAFATWATAGRDRHPLGRRCGQARRRGDPARRTGDRLFRCRTDRRPPAFRELRKIRPETRRLSPAGEAFWKTL